MAEKREAQADEAVIAFAVAMHGLRCPKQPQHSSAANKKTSGINKRGFSGLRINNSESKVIKAMIWLLALNLCHWTHAAYSQLRLWYHINCIIYFTIIQVYQKEHVQYVGYNEHQTQNCTFNLYTHFPWIYMEISKSKLNYLIRSATTAACK